MPFTGMEVTRMLQQRYRQVILMNRNGTGLDMGLLMVIVIRFQTLMYQGVRVCGDLSMKPPIYWNIAFPVWN